MSVTTNYRKIIKHIPSSVTIAAVVKHQSNQDIIMLYEAGQRVFAENKVQDFLKKYDFFSDYQMEWHFIGHLQRNKVKYIIDKVSLIHSLDSTRLAEEISHRAIKMDKVIDCLVQVNTGDEENKFGIHFNDCSAFIESIKDLKGIRIRGLMAVTPYSENPEDSRPYFRQMKQLYDIIAEKYQSTMQFDILSMGMSNDYHVAVEEGANMIRVGSLLFD